MGASNNNNWIKDNRETKQQQKQLVCERAAYLVVVIDRVESFFI